MHIKIILGEKLDCVGTTFPTLTQLAKDLKERAFEVDERLEADPNIEGAEAMHELLEQIQTDATDYCDNQTAPLVEMETVLQSHYDGLGEFVG